MSYICKRLYFKRVSLFVHNIIHTYVNLLNVCRTTSRSICAFNNFQININPKLSRSRLTFRSPGQTYIHEYFRVQKRIECKHTLRTFCAASKLKYRHVAPVNNDQNVAKRSAR